MQFDSLNAFLSGGAAVLAKGPIALIFAEDAAEIDSTLRHHLDQGFRSVVAFVPPGVALAADTAARCQQVRMDTLAEGAVQGTVNAVIAKATGQWLYYCYNGEYLFYPFCETRSIGEMLGFHAEERRDAMLTFVVDLYAADLERFPDAIAVDEAFLDKSGYYALARHDPITKNPKERQLNFFGGLRWRFEEHIPPPRRRIDRIGIFRARPGLELRADHTLNDEEYNTFACPWHNNLTAAICSFRTAKALKRNPGSTFDIDTFRWHNSIRFEWHSRQLLDLGLMEPGQWF